MNGKKAVTLTKNADSGSYGCSGYGIGFDTYSIFSSSNGECHKYVIFGKDNISSRHIDNR